MNWTIPVNMIPLSNDLVVVCSIRGIMSIYLAKMSFNMFLTLSVITGMVRLFMEEVKLHFHVVYIL